MKEKPVGQDETHAWLWEYVSPLHMHIPLYKLEPDGQVRQSVLVGPSQLRQF